MIYRNRLILVLRLALGALVVLAWEALVRMFPETCDPNLFGQPTRIVSDFVDYTQSGFLLKDTVATLSAAILGLVIGIILGLCIGVLFGSLRHTYTVFEPYFVGLNSLPRPALAPILVLWFGLGLTSKIFLSASLVFFVVFFNTLSGVRQTDRSLVDAVCVTGASWWQVFRLVTLPSLYGWVFAGFRTSVSLALIGAVVGEFVGASRGLGYRMMIATGVLDTHLAFGILLWMGVLGAVAVMLGTAVERRLLRWKSSYQAQSDVKI